ncbi:MAG TPA: hypothetical protein VM513_30430 [Kofleriaceae bacterium]|nr:hypothetical protein [Kofleriaceae bacterium]
MSLVRDCLDRAPTEHTKAVSHSFVPAGETLEQALGGADIRAPARPPFEYPEREVLEAHRDALFADRRIHDLIVHGTRPTAQARWEVSAKLVSFDEHAGLQALRAGIDEQVFAELRSALTDGVRWIFFGRNSGKPPRLGRGVPKLEELQPTTRLLDLLAAADHLYHEAGHALITLTWRVGPDEEPSVQEYFE